jgi:hypothetical protein
VDDLRKKILLDLCVTPGTTIPAAIGVSMLLLGMVMGSMVVFVGFLCCLAGFGALVTNFVFNLSKVSQSAAKQWQKQQQAKKDGELDRLDEQLQNTREVKDENALRNLRALYQGFCTDFESGKISSTVPPTMLSQIDEIFQSCIHQLSRSYEIYEQSRRVTGNLRKGLEGQRKQILTDVEKSVETLAQVITEVTAMRLETTRGELDRLQGRLTSQLAVAKATEEQVRTLDGVEDPDKYDEYLNPQE